MLCRWRSAYSWDTCSGPKTSRLRREEEGQRRDDVDAAEHRALEPVGPAVEGDEAGYHDRLRDVGDGGGGSEEQYKGGRASERRVTLAGRHATLGAAEVEEQVEDVE